MKRWLAVWLCILTMGIGVCGCADAKEIDDTSFVLTLGIDKGTEKTYEISFQIPVLAEQDSPTFRTIVCQAEGLSDAVALLNANTPYRVDFTHLNFLVIGKELAEEGISQIVDAMMRMPQIRKGAMMIVAQQTAKEFVQSLQSDEDVNLIQLQQSILSEAGSSGLFPHYTLDMFYDSLREQRSAAVVALGAKRQSNKTSEGGSAVSDLPGDTSVDSSIDSELIGAAVFQNDRLVGTLTGEQTRVWCMATGQFDSGEISMKNPFGEGLLTVRIKSAGTPTTDIAGTENVQATIHIPLNAFLVSYPGTEDYETQTKKEELVPYIQQILQAQLDELCQSFASWQVDGFGIGDTAVTDFSTQQEWLDYQWQDKIQNLQVTVVPEVYVSLYRPELGEQR